MKFNSKFSKNKITAIGMAVLLIVALVAVVSIVPAAIFGGTKVSEEPAAAATTGYSKTVTNKEVYLKFQEAWEACIDHNDDPTYHQTFTTSGGVKVAEVFYDDNVYTTEVVDNGDGTTSGGEVVGAMTFKMFQDWGALNAYYTTDTLYIDVNGTQNFTSYMNAPIPGTEISYYKFNGSAAPYVTEVVTGQLARAEDVKNLLSMYYQDTTEISGTTPYSSKQSYKGLLNTRYTGVKSMVSCVTYPIFGGDPYTITDYYQHGALRVKGDKAVQFDLNGHNLNRNLFFDGATTIRSGGTYTSDDTSNHALLKYYLMSQAGGHVIFGEGKMYLDDTSDTSKATVDANGLSGIGRVCGGNTNHPLGGWEGGGIRTHGWSSLLVQKNGAVCYTGNAGRGGGIYSYCTYRTFGGIVAHNITLGYGGALYLYSGNAILNNLIAAYNTTDVSRYSGDYTSELTSASGYPSGTIHTRNNSGSQVTLNNCSFHDNYAQRGGIAYLNISNPAEPQQQAKFTINSGEYYNNYANFNGSVGYINSGINTAEINGGHFYNNGTGGDGGCIYINQYASFVMNAGTFENNYATNNGGSIFLQVDTSVTMTGGTFDGNIARNGNGGGIYVSARSSFNLSGGEFKNCKAKGDGGGIYTEGRFTMSGGKFTNNKSGETINGSSPAAGIGSGGGIYMKSGTFDMSGGEFDGNGCKLDGGGIYMASGTFGMTDGDFVNNECGGSGGGIYIKSGDFTIGGGKFQNNKAKNGNGGGVYMFAETIHQEVEEGVFEDIFVTSNFTMTGGLFDKNSSAGSAGGYGGGVYMMAGEFKMSGGKFTGNTCTQSGGGVYMISGDFTIDNAEFSGNSCGVSGGGIYIKQGTFEMTSGAFNDNSASGTSSGSNLKGGGGVFMEGGKFTMSGGEFLRNEAANGHGGAFLITAVTETNMTLHSGENKSITVSGNAAANYPGFYCGANINMGGTLYIQKNINERGREQNIYLAERLAVIYLITNVRGYIGVTKATDGDNEVYIATGNYTLDPKKYGEGTARRRVALTADDALVFHNDTIPDGVTKYIFTTVLYADYTDYADMENYIYLSSETAHKHSWTQRNVAATCTTSGYFCTVCIGCQEIWTSEEYGPEGTKYGYTEANDGLRVYAPQGHIFVIDNTDPERNTTSHVELMCSHAGCDAKAYAEINPVEDVFTYNGSDKRPTPGISVYIYGDDDEPMKMENAADAEAIARYYMSSDAILSGSNVTGTPTYTYLNNKNATVGENHATVTGTVTRGVSTNYTYVYPYGTYAGQRIWSDGGYRTATVSFRTTVTLSEYFTIGKGTVNVTVTQPSGTWYLKDADTYYSRFSARARLESGTNLSSEGYLTYLYYDEDGELCETLEGEHPSAWSKDADGNEVVYFYFVPKTTNIEVGTITITAAAGSQTGMTYEHATYGTVPGVGVTIHDYTLQSLSAYQYAVTFRDEDGFDPIKEKLSLQARLNKAGDTTTSFPQIVSDATDPNNYHPEAYTLVIVNPNDTTQEYNTLRMGRFILRIYYTYNGKTLSFDCSNRILITSADVASIKAVQKEGADGIVHDTAKLDDIKDALEVTSYNESGEPTGTLTTYALSCTLWGRGARTYVVTVDYNGVETEVNVVVTAVTLVGVTATWKQTSEIPTTKELSDIPDYGELVVKAYLSDGSDFVVEKNDQTGKDGYVLVGSIAKEGANKFTVTYKYTNPLDRKKKEMSTTVPFEVVSIFIDYVVSVKVEKKNGLDFFADASVDQFSRRRQVEAVYASGKEVVIYDLVTAQNTYKEPADRVDQLFYQIDAFNVNSEEQKIYYSVFLYKLDVYMSSGSIKELAISQYFNENIETERKIVAHSNEPTTAEEYWSPMYWVKKAWIITEYWNDDTQTEAKTVANSAIFDMSRILLVENTTTGGAYFLPGKNRVLVAYIDSAGNRSSDYYEVTVSAMTFESVTVEIDTDDQAERINPDNNQLEKIPNMLKEELIYENSTYDDIANYITVVGHNGNNEYVVTAYAISGLFVAEDTPQLFNIIVTLSTSGQEYSIPIYVPVSSTRISRVEAKITQGDRKIYTTTQAISIYDLIELDVFYYGGRMEKVYGGFEAAIAGGYFVEVPNGVQTNQIVVNWTSPSGFPYYPVTNDELVITPTVVNKLTITSRQGQTVVYPSSNAATISNVITVRASYNDPEKAADNISYDATGANGYTITGSLDSEEGMFVSYQGQTEQITDSILSITPIAIATISVELKSSNVELYTTYSMDIIKNYITVSYVNNDRTTGILDADGYTLVCDQMTVDGKPGVGNRTFTVTTTNGKQATFQASVAADRLRNIVNVIGTQGSAIIYSSTSFEALKQYMTVTAAYESSYDPETKKRLPDAQITNPDRLVNGEEYDIIGDINSDGTYSLELRLNAVSYSLSNRPYSMSSSAENPVFTITPKAVTSYTVTNNQGENRIFSGADNSEAAAYLDLEVHFNDGDVQHPEYGEYTLVGNLTAAPNYSNGELVIATCQLTLSYTFAHYEPIEVTSDQTKFKVTPIVFLGIRASVSGLGTLFHINLFSGDTVDLNKLKTALASHIIVEAVRNNGTALPLGASDFYYKSAAPKGTATANDIKLSGGYVVATVKSDTYGETDIEIKVARTLPTSLKPVRIEGTTVYSTGTSNDVKNAFKVYETFNDGSPDKELAPDSGYTVSISGRIALGDLLTVTFNYYDVEFARPVNGTTTLQVEKVVPKTIAVTFDNAIEKVYTSSTEATIRKTLKVYITYTNTTVPTTVEDYDLIYGELYGSDTFPVTVKYTYNGTPISTVKEIKVIPVAVSKVNVDTVTRGLYSQTGVDGDENPIYEQTKLVFTTENLDYIRQFLLIKLFRNDGTEATDYGEITVYDMEIFNSDDEPADMSVAGTYRVLVSYLFDENTTLTGEFYLTVTELAIVSEEVTSNLESLFSDYNFFDSQKSIQDSLQISATWNDEANHAGSYVFKVWEVAENRDSNNELINKNQVKVTYSYTPSHKSVTSNDIKTVLVELTLIKAVIVAIDFVPNDEYTLYTSSDVRSAAGAIRLFTTYNSNSRIEVKNWIDKYPNYLVTAPTWSEGGDVNVVVSVSIYPDEEDGDLVCKPFTLYITPVALEEVEVSYVQNGTVYSSANAAKIIAAGTFTLTGTYNDGQPLTGARITADNLSFDFVNTATEQDVTVDYQGFIRKVKVRISVVYITSISVNMTKKEIYSSSYISSLANQITVTGTYNDGIPRELSYGSGYTFASGATIENNTASNVTRNIAIYSVQRNQAGNIVMTNIQGLVIKPRILKEIIAHYNQNGVEVYEKGKIAGVLAAPHSLVVNGKFENSDTGEEATEAISNYTVYYFNGNYTDLPTVSGTEDQIVTLNVQYIYGGEAHLTSFNVTVTPKKVIGLDVEYTQYETETIYTTTLPQELVETVGEVPAKGTMMLYYKCNDGDRIDIGSTDDLTFGDVNNGFTITGSVADEIVIARKGTDGTGNTYTKTLRMSDLVEVVTPTIISLSVDTAEGVTLFTTDTEEEVKGKLVVLGEYDDDHSAPKTLAANEYTMQYQSYVGLQNIVITANEGVVNEICEPCEGDFGFIQKVAQDDAMLIYFTDDGWYDVPFIGIAQQILIDGELQIRFSFIAHDAKGNTVNASIGGSFSYTDVYNTKYEIVREINAGTYTPYANSIVGDHYVGDDSYFDLSAVTQELKINNKIQTGIQAKYEQSGSVYSTTSKQELISKVGDVEAKGTLTLYKVYNNDTIAEDPMSEYTLGDIAVDAEDPAKGTVAVICGYLETSISVILTEIAIDRISAEVVLAEGETFVYGVGNQDVIAKIVITGYYNDDNHTAPATLGIAAKDGVEYVFDKDVDNWGDYTVTVDVSKVAGYSEVASADAAFSVAKATITDINIQGHNDVYSGEDEDAVVAGYSATTVKNQALTWEFRFEGEENYSTVMPTVNEVCDRKVEYIVSAANHDSVSGSVNVKVSKRVISVVVNDMTFMNVPNSTRPTKNDIDGTVNNLAKISDKTIVLFDFVEEEEYNSDTSVNLTRETYTLVAKLDTENPLSSNYELPEANITNGTLTVIESEIVGIVVTLGGTVTYGSSDADIRKALTISGYYDANNIESSSTVLALNNVAELTFKYGDEEIAASAVSTLAAGNTYTVEVALAEGDGIKAGGVSASVDFEVACAEITVPEAGVVGYSAPYDGKSHAALVSKTASTVNDMEMTWSFTYNNEPVDISELTFKDHGSYVVGYTIVAPNHLEKTGTFEVSIAKANLTVIVYDRSVKMGQDADPNYSVSGLIGSDAKNIVKVVYVGPAYNKETAQEGDTFTMTAEIDDDAAGAGNYAIPIGSVQTGTLTVLGRLTKLQIKTDSGLSYAVSEGNSLSAVSDRSNHESSKLFITGVQAGTTLQDLCDKLDNGTEGVTAVDSDSKDLGLEDCIGTGTKIKLTGDDISDVLEVVVVGDVDGDGIIGTSDDATVAVAVSGKKQIEGSAFYAADIDGDGVITAFDNLLLMLVLGGVIINF